MLHALDSRFNDKFNSIIALEGLFLAYINLFNAKSKLKPAKLYCEDVEGSDLVLMAEINLWKNKCAEIQNTLKNFS